MTPELVDVLQTLGAALGPFLGYLFGRRQQRAAAHKMEAEATGQEIDNAQEVVELYRALAEDVRRQASEELAILRRRIVYLEEAVVTRDRRIAALEKAVAERDRRIAVLTLELEQLRKEVTNGRHQAPRGE